MRSIRSAADIVALTNEWGFLPFFENGIPGFSVEELTPKELWFASDVDGPWEWKGPVIRASGCAYGKISPCTAVHGLRCFYRGGWLSCGCQAR